jgi:hypothetical protein
VCRLFCLWLYGHSDKLDPLSGVLAALGDRLSVMGVCVGCIVTQMNTTLVNRTTYASPQLVCVAVAMLLMLDISSYWVHICAQVRRVDVDRQYIACHVIADHLEAK